MQATGPAPLGVSAGAWQVRVVGTGLLLLAGLVACTPPYRPRVAQYQNIVLDARELGAKQLDIEMQRDRTIREYVARNGKPDFIYVPSATVVELMYVPSSKLILFYRERPGADSVTGELSPLPLEVTNVLPVDIRAGTPGPIAGNTPTSCWTASAATHRCHTCCKGPLFCSTSCKQEPSRSAEEPSSALHPSHLTHGPTTSAASSAEHGGRRSEMITRENGTFIGRTARREEIAMRYVPLGKAELEVSAIAFGTWAFGGDWGS